MKTRKGVIAYANDRRKNPGNPGFFDLLFDLMMALQSTETHDISLKNLALFRPKLCDSCSTNQIARFVNYYCYGANGREFSIPLKN